MRRFQVESALAKYYSTKFSGNVWCTFDSSKRAYLIQGDNLKPHPAMANLYPNGWSLLDWVSPSKARGLIHAN